MANNDLPYRHFVELRETAVCEQKKNLMPMTSLKMWGLSVLFGQICILHLNFANHY